MLAIFEAFVKGLGEEITLDELIEKLAALRAKFGIDAALRGFEIDWETAVELLNSEEAELTYEEKKRRDVLMAAFENIVDFAVAEEYQAMESMEDAHDGFGWDMDLEEGELDGMTEVFEKYNLNYMVTENGDIAHAMHIALGIYLLSGETMLTYHTQMDDRVRPWHMQYEGYSVPKAIFPEWLIPPIEHGCRCFLEEEAIYGRMNVRGAVFNIPKMPEWFNPTFKESVAFGGRIFSDEHPYFSVDDADVEKLNAMSKRILEGLLNA